MGNVWAPGVATLYWPEGHYLHGLEIVMRRRPLGEVLDLWREFGSDDQRLLRDMTPAERADSMQDSVEKLAKLVEEWNAVDRKTREPIEPTVEGLLATLGFDDVDDVWTAYRDATTRVAPPLPPSSADGSPSAEAELQLPMAALSGSPPTSPPP
jgi:hypothetical protein